MAHVGDLRRDDLGLRRSGVEEELVDLMRADVAQDAAVLLRIPRTTRAGRSAAAGIAACPGRSDGARC